MQRSAKHFFFIILASSIKLIIRKFNKEFLKWDHCIFFKSSTVVICCFCLLVSPESFDREIRVDAKKTVSGMCVFMRFVDNK